MRRLVLVLLLCAACAPSSDPARAVEAQVWSPYCPGRLLVDCSTQQASELRDEIAQRIDEGDSEKEVIAWVREEFGDSAIAAPDTSAGGLVIWLVPALIFLIGATMVVRYLRRNVSTSG